MAIVTVPSPTRHQPPWPVLASSFLWLFASQSSGAAASGTESREQFSFERLIVESRELAKTPYLGPIQSLPVGMENVDYAQYQQIQFKPDRTIWLDSTETIGLQLFHRGFLFKDQIEVSLVENGVSNRLNYNKSFFTFGSFEPSSDDSTIGFAGLRLVTRSKASAKLSEFAVFLGASYFRAIGEGQNYGLSGRGLALGTGEKAAEEFPVFRKFFVEKSTQPVGGSVVYALLDSPSVTGAYVFRIKPGATTVMSVEARLHPRHDLDEVGLAPGTSMFHFNSNSRREADDYRPQIHDSDGLLIHNGKGEMLWRPLSNPRSVQISDFGDDSPRGFGLVQRARNFSDYEDIWARYELRPNLWVKPIGKWGPGAVRLVEIPTASEFFDNIVAFWRPKTPLAAGKEIRLSYELQWGKGPADHAGLYVDATRQGRVQGADRSEVRQFAIDFVDPSLPEVPVGLDLDSAPPDAKVDTSDGEIRGVLVFRHRKGWRLMFQLDPKGSRSSELRAELVVPNAKEVWLYRWVQDD